MGAANLASGLFGGMIVGGGMSGTAANNAAGARTQVSTLTASGSVGLTLAFLLPLFRNLPEAVLGAIVVHAVAHLADFGTLKYYAKLRTGSIWVALVALVGVLQFGILKGLILAVGLTLIALMHKLSSPQDSVLGRLPGSDNFVDVARHAEAEPLPGLLIFRPNGVWTRFAFAKKTTEFHCPHPCLTCATTQPIPRTEEDGPPALLAMSYKSQSLFMFRHSRINTRRGAAFWTR